MKINKMLAIGAVALMGFVGNNVHAGDGQGYDLEKMGSRLGGAVGIDVMNHKELLEIIESFKINAKIHGEDPRFYADAVDTLMNELLFYKQGLEESMNQSNNDRVKELLSDALSKVNMSLMNLDKFVPRG